MLQIFKQRYDPGRYNPYQFSTSGGDIREAWMRSLDIDVIGDMMGNKRR